MKPFVKIYTDGACSNNPGNGGFGVVLMYIDKNNIEHEKQFSKGYKLTTNNRMELMAVNYAIKALKSPCKIQLYSDSKYVTDAINKNWIISWQKNNWKTSSNKPVKNIDLWQEFISLIKPHDIEFIWVKGHNENKYNELCDFLAVQARSKNDLEDDIGFLDNN